MCADGTLLAEGPRKGPAEGAAELARVKSGALPTDRSVWGQQRRAVHQSEQTR